MHGEPLPPTRPVLAAAQRAGQVSPEQVSIIERGLDRVDRLGFDPGHIDAAEALLTGHAHTFGPADLKQLTDRVVDRIDPDGTLPTDQLNEDRRHFHLRPAADGTYRGESSSPAPPGRSSPPSSARSHGPAPTSTPNPTITRWA